MYERHREYLTLERADLICSSILQVKTEKKSVDLLYCVKNRDNYITHKHFSGDNHLISIAEKKVWILSRIPSSG